MKLKYSTLTRKRFLNFLLGGWLVALGSTLLYPILRFITPPYREPDKILLSLADCQSMVPHSAMRFAWGTKPGLLIKNEQGFRAFVGVCTHLDCNVTWQQNDRKFFCACHDGWYDEHGTNIAGPPPRPLRQLVVEIADENVIIKKEEEKA